MPQPAHQSPAIGVLAMQGAFREHVAVLRAIGAQAREVRTADELAQVDGLVIPGGESTTMRKLLARGDLYDALGERLRQGMPAFGTCAGLIVLADAPPDGAPPCYAVLDVEVERNGFGRQPHSFEAPVALDEREVHGVFIRAPRIRAVGEQVEVIGRLRLGKEGSVAARRRGDEPVAVRQGALLGCTFHPELTGDASLHELFASICAAQRTLRHEGEVVGRAQ